MFRPLGRGMRDTLDNLLPFTLATFAWWLSVLLVVTAPAGTLALFRYADPRRQSDHLRPARSEAIAYVRTELVRAWAIALAFGLPLLALVNNLVAYRDADSAIRWLRPLWVLLLLLVVAAGAVTCSLRAVHGQPTTTAIKTGVVMALARAHRLLPVVIVLWVIVAIGGLLVIPALMFVPALVAVTVNHFVYDIFEIPVADSLDPTEERIGEDQRARGGKYSTG